MEKPPMVVRPELGRWEPHPHSRVAIPAVRCAPREGSIVPAIVAVVTRFPGKPWSWCVHGPGGGERMGTGRDEADCRRQADDAAEELGWALRGEGT